MPAMYINQTEKAMSLPDVSSKTFPVLKDEQFPFTLRCPGCGTKHVIQEETIYSFCSCFLIDGPVYKKKESK